MVFGCDQNEPIFQTFGTVDHLEPTSKLIQIALTIAPKDYFHKIKLTVGQL